MGTLRVFKVRDSETHYVVALDERDALTVLSEHNMLDDYRGDVDAYRAEERPMIGEVSGDTVIKFTDDDAVDGGHRSATADEWVASEGRCFLCSTVY